jgi:hypothetical protein
MWPSTLREQLRLRVAEKNVRRNTSERINRTLKFVLFTSDQTSECENSRAFRLTYMGNTINAYKILARHPESKTPFGRYLLSVEYNIKNSNKS